MATVRAVVSMFEMHKLVYLEPDTGSSQPGRVPDTPDMELSNFIEDLVPGTDAHSALDSASALAMRMLKNMSGSMRMPRLAFRPAL